jgi:hypothetical protein
MTLPLILCATALALVLATAATGLAIAVLERRSLVPTLLESAFVGLAGTGAAALVASVVVLHPALAEDPTRGGAFKVLGDTVAGDAPAVEIAGPIEHGCYPEGAAPSYDRLQDQQAPRSRGKGDDGHEIPVLRPSRSR